MHDQDEDDRRRAIQLYVAGQKPAAICSALRRSKRWFYKWLKRYEEAGADWWRDESRRPKRSPRQTQADIEQAVVRVRAELEAEALFAGAQAILWRMEELRLSPLPSVRTIGRILFKHDLVRRRQGRYQPKGKKYPALTAVHPGDVHQTDFVGPCYLTGPIRYYSLNSVDIATGRCANQPLIGGRKAVIDALWATWTRLGMPLRQQVDNEMVFFGSPAHPRGMGALIRLCLPLGIEPVFIPMREPWRNGVVEKFNDHWQGKFVRRVTMTSAEELIRESLAFEHRHNQRWRYTKLGGKTPLEALAGAGRPLRFPPTEAPPRRPLAKPVEGRYHVVRFIRSDGLLNVFSEKFKLPPEAVYEYIQATVDVGRQRLSVRLGDRIVDEIEYALR